MKHIFKVIGRVSGMDVDAIDAKAKIEAAADAKAAAARQAALYAAAKASSAQPAPPAQ